MLVNGSLEKRTEDSYGFTPDISLPFTRRLQETVQVGRSSGLLNTLNLPITHCVTVVKTLKVQ